jgi:hypothetical protein
VDAEVIERKSLSGPRPLGGAMNHELEPVDEKKLYEPPQLVTISLRPEEAVLGHCKIAGSGGPVSSSCAALNCMTIGS